MEEGVAKGKEVGPAFPLPFLGDLAIDVKTVADE